MQLFSLPVLGMQSGHMLSIHRQVPPSRSWEWGCRDMQDSSSRTSDPQAGLWGYSGGISKEKGEFGINSLV